MTFASILCAPRGKLNLSFMAFLNALGDVLLGVGGEAVSVNGKLVASPGGEARWLGHNTFLYVAPYADERWGVWRATHVSGSISTELFSPRGANELAAGDGTWAAWLAGYGLYLVNGTVWPAAGLRDVAMDGSLWAVPDRNDGHHLSVVTDPDPSKWRRITSEFSDSVCAADKYTAVWLTGNRVRSAGFGSDPVTVDEPIFYVRLVWIQNAWRLLYITGDRLLLQMAWHEPRGYVIPVDYPIAAGDGTFRPDARWLGATVKVAWSRRQGERPEDLVTTAIDPSVPWVDLERQATVPPIGRPCWLAWFEFGRPSPLPPGNGYIPVTPGAIYAPVRAVDAEKIALFVTASNDSDLDELNTNCRVAKAANPLYDTLAYWTRQAQAVGVPQADIAGVEAYMLAGEPPAAFMLRVQRAVRVVRRAWLIARCDTSNVSLTQDVRAVVPLYAQLARNHRNIEGIAVFCGGPGRSPATSWDGHPEVHGPWRELAGGISGVPVIIQPEPPPPTPPSPEPPMAKSHDQVKADVTELIRFYNAPDGLNRQARGLPAPLIVTDPAVFDWCVLLLTQTIEGVKQQIRQFPEYREQHQDPAPPPAPPVNPAIQGRLQRDGRLFINDGGIFRPRFASCLAALRPGHDYRPSLDEIAAVGFNGVRVFAGRLTWCGQEFHHVRERLPQFLAECAGRGLYAEVVALTDTRDISRAECEAHLDAVTIICRALGNALVQGGNEIGPVHETQRHDIIEICCAYAPDGILYCPGSVHGGGFCEDASLMTDEQRLRFETEQQAPYWDEISALCHTYGASHLQDRTDRFDAERRARELELSSADRGVPWFGDEQQGAGEGGPDPSSPFESRRTEKVGRRFTDPAIAFAQGVNSRVFEIGRTFHSQAGLWADPFGPAERACAQAFVVGATVLPVSLARLTFKNARWGDSPVASANFKDDEHPHGTVLRVFSAVRDGHGITVALQETGDPQIEYKNGWHPADEPLAQYGSFETGRVTVWEVRQ